jgi:uncharacterized membrane protein YbhN (UPF0104 family)
MESVKKPLLWLRLAGAVAAILALGFVLHRIHPAALLDVVRTTRPGWAGAAVALYGLMFIPAAWRWHLALRLIGCAVRFGVTLRVSLIGHFFYTILFGAAGGDFAKAVLYSRWYTQPLPEILAAASLDRLMGFGGLILFALLAFATAFQHDGLATLHSVSFQGVGWWLVLVVVVSMAIVFLASRSRADSGPGRFIKAFRKSFRQLLASPRVFGPGLLFGLLVQIALSGVLALNLQAVSHTPLPWLKLLWTFPIISVISGLPITVAGLGVRESAAFVLLGLCGVARTDAVAASLLTAGASLVWTLVSGVVLSWEARKRKQKLFGTRWVPDPAPPLAAPEL